MSDRSTAGATSRPGVGQSGGGRAPISSEPETTRIGDWLLLEEDGTVTVYTGKVEVGQGIRTSLAQAVADELRLPIKTIRLVMGDTAVTPFDPGTFGSRSTPHMAPRLQRVAAATRELLLDMAVMQWRVTRDELRVADGQVAHSASGRSARFVDLVGDSGLYEQCADSTPVMPSEEWTLAGTSVSSTNARNLVTGKHQYTTDLSMPGMLAGKVLRPPVQGAELLWLETSAAEAIPGVTVVREEDFVGFTAQDALTAARAIAAVRAQWSVPSKPSHQEIYEYLRTHPAAQDSERSAQPFCLEQGSLAAGRATADLEMAATYTMAYIAHAPLEPRAAIAEWKGDALTVWTGTQRPFGVRGELSLVFQVPEERIRVIVPDTGSAYGGKHTGDAAVEAARLARATGKPVKVIWTREEEFKYAYLRPAGVIDVVGAVLSDGTLTGWEYHNYNSGAAGIQMPYAVPNQQVEFHPSASPLRQGSYRALASTANHFARESHMDELAHALDMDPLKFRLLNLQDERIRAVLEVAAARFGWTEKTPTHGIGYGIACGTEKGSYVATCVEVQADQAGGQVRVTRVLQAYECGAIVNPDNLRNQVEGAIIQGLGGALFEEVQFEQGEVISDRFSRYRVPRFRDIPDIETVLLDRRDLPSAGAGEAPIIGIAPAVGNAIFDATGIRLRSMPMTIQTTPHEA